MGTTARFAVSTHGYLKLMCREAMSATAFRVTNTSATHDGHSIKAPTLEIV
jgi:hypothetical protein